MKPLRLYRVEPEASPTMHVAARSSDQAAEIFITLEASKGGAPEQFSVELVRMETLDPGEQIQLRSLLVTSTEGIAYFRSGRGWSIDSDGWTSFDSSEEVR